MNVIQLAPGIEATLDPDLGPPRVAGTRVTVEVVLRTIASGRAVAEVARIHGLAQDQVQACLAYASTTPGWVGQLAEIHALDGLSEEAVLDEVHAFRRGGRGQASPGR